MHEIAHSVGMPVYLMQQEMPYDELNKWVAYFNRRPLGWREDLRAFYLIAAQGYKGKPHELFPSLEFLNKEESKENSTKGLARSALFRKILGAKGGEKLKVLGEL